MKKYYVFAIILSLITLAVIIAGITITGTPIDAKKAASDSKRITDLTNIKYAVESYVYKNNKLPANLNDLPANISTTDPESKLPYDYQIVNSARYKLCTTFDTAARTNNLYTGYADIGYNHTKGNNCFEFDVQIKTAPENTQSTQSSQPQNNQDKSKSSSYFAYKGTSDQTLDKTTTGTLNSMSLSADNKVVTAIVLANDNTMTLLLDEKTKVFKKDSTGNSMETEAIMLNTGDKVTVVYGYASNGAYYARTITKE